METKAKSLHWLLPLLSALFLLSGLTACDSTEDSVEDPAKPEVPIADGDWQIVPATGGTITKDSISITFPSGTFAEETKVAITEIKKGEIGGEYEASKFYQITMPCTASKPLSFKVKNSERNDDINFVALANVFNLCKGEEKKVELHYDTKYSNGEYSATIPAINGDVEDDNIYFTVGLGRFTNSESNKTRGLILPYETLLEGKVKNVSYKIRYRWTTFDDWASHIWGQGTLDKVVKMSGRIDNYVQEALTKIQDLGFKPKGEKVLYVDFDPSEKDDWGGFQVCGIPGEGGWSMWVSLGINKLLNPITTEEDIRCTVVHEIFHWFQYFHDPRSNYKKSKKSYGGEEGVLYEMGGVWAEHLLNDGRLNTNYLFSEVLFGEIFQDKMGLTDYFDRLPKKGGKTDNDIRGQQGYSMGPLLYYLCSTNALKDFGIGNDKVLELHEQWGKSFVNTLFAGSSLVKPTIEILDHWVFGTHNCGIFSGCQIDNYYLNLLSGKVLKDISIFTHYDFLNTKTLKNTDKERLIDITFDKIPFEGTVYPYGYAFRSIQFKGLKGQTLKNKKLVIKQEKEGVQTYLLTANRTDKIFERIGTVAKGQDSIVVSGDKLESYRKADGTFDQYFFFVTTRTTNSTSDRGTKPWKVNVELQDEKKEELPVAKGMINKMYMLATMEGKTDGGSSTHFGFGFSTESELHAPPVITTRKDGSTLHVESSQEYTHAIQWGHQTEKQSVSFDILNFTDDLKNATVTNFKIYSKTVASVSPPPDEWLIMGEDEEGEIELNNIVSPSVKEMDDGTTRLYFKNGTWKVTAEYGLLEVISGYCIKSGSSSSRTYFYDDSQVAEIEMELYFNK